MNKNRIFILLLFISAALFVAYFLLLSYHSRLCSDDLYFLNDFIDKGWFRSIADFQLNKRWPSFLLFNTVFLFNHDFQTLHWNIFMFNVLTFSLLIFSMYSLSKVIFHKILSVHVPSLYVLITALFFVISFYFSTSQSIEVWFWTIAIPIYLYPIIFFALGLANILSEKKSIITYFVIAFSFLFIGGASENFAMIIIFIVSVGLILYYFSKKHLEIQVSKLWIAWFSLWVLFLVNLLCGGVVNRLSFEDKYSNFVLNLNWSSLINVFIQIKILVFGYFLFVVFFIGNYFCKNGFVISRFKIQKAIIFNLLFLIIIALLTFLPLVYVFHNLGPERAWVPLNFFICISLFAWSFYSGNRFSWNFKIFPIVKNLLVFVSIVILSFYMVKHYPIVSEFSEKYDARIDTLLQFKRSGNTKPVYLAPLPDSGPLVSQELNNVNGRTNIGLEKVLKLKYKIFVNK